MISFSFQQSKTQMGIRNVVRIIKRIESPSTANKISLFAKGNHEMVSTNWKFERRGSNPASNNTEPLNTKRDQKREKFRIKTTFVLSIKRRAKAPIKGSIIKADNIF